MKKNIDNEPSRGMDLVAVAGVVWASRRTVLMITAAVVAAGLAAALLGEVRYSAGTIVAARTEELSGGSIQGLAAMAGINLSETGQSNGITPKLYPMVAGSVPFLKELMQTTVDVAGHDGPVTLVDYFTRAEYRPFSFFRFVAAYTVRLPWTIAGALRKGDPQPTAAPPPGVETLTAREFECIREIKRRVTVKVDELDGYVALTVAMPEAVMAARVAQRASELLEAYITRFKVQKVQADLDFIEERYADIRLQFEAAQQALAEFRDANRDISSARARTREERFENEYNLAFTLYSELAGQREQARIRVKEDTPVFTVIEPVTVPSRKSAPRRALLLAISVMAGLGAGVGWVLAAPSVKSIVAGAGNARKPKKK